MPLWSCRPTIASAKLEPAQNNRNETGLHIRSPNLILPNLCTVGDGYITQRLHERETRPRPTGIEAIRAILPPYILSRFGVVVVKFFLMERL